MHTLARVCIQLLLINYWYHGIIKVHGTMKTPQVSELAQNFHFFIILMYSSSSTEYNIILLFVSSVR